MIIQCDLLGTK